MNLRRVLVSLTVLISVLSVQAPGQSAETNPRAQPQDPAPSAKPKADGWAWQKVRAISPPTVEAQDWANHPIDRFIYRQLRQNKLRPSSLADRKTLARRARYLLTGLPPSPAELTAFLADESKDAFASLVDRLLATPAYSEHQARHWLDLVRYAESLGHENDYTIPSAWRYRDYVIRAFEQDVPYDQFVREHIAGDLLSSPRRDPHRGTNESVIGTCFFWFCDQTHSPVDVLRHRADRTDNQIDVLSKTFLGLTISCARCHDHKFDPISTVDYYGLSGYLKSSRFTLQPTLNKQELDRALQKISQKRSSILAALPAALQSQASRLTSEFRDARQRAAQARTQAQTQATTSPKNRRRKVPIPNAIPKGKHGRYTTATPGERGQTTDPRAAQRARWDRTLASDPMPKLTGLVLSPGSIEFFPGEPTGRRHRDSDDAQAWFLTGRLFGPASRDGEPRIESLPDRSRLRFDTRAQRHSASLSNRLEGELCSPTFRIAKRYIYLRAHGKKTRINIVLEGFDVIRNPIYGGLKRQLNSDKTQGILIDVGMWQGHNAYIQCRDTVAHDLAANNDPVKTTDGYLALEQVIFCDKPPKEIAGTMPGTEDQRIEQALTSLGTGAHSRADAAILDWLARHELLDLSQLADPLRDFRRLETAIQPANCVPGMADGTGQDEHVFERGSHTNLGPIAQRHFLTALTGETAAEVPRGSGRLALARQIADAKNPLTARVYVNRIWHHLYGRGIVETVDNFGKLGKAPTHPELLDWLTTEFIAKGWSTKHLIKLMLTSRTWQLQSQDTAEATAIDPANKLWHRAEVRRMSGEMIRDSLLALSNTLDSTRFGPAIPVHLTAFMDGRGKPKSGPLDGARRRSIYLSVRRNFLSPLLQAFDTPLPFNTIGRRNISNVPAQALTLQNDPFIHQLAKDLANSTAGAQSATARIIKLYLSMLSRPPSDRELKLGLSFVETEGCTWSDYCHVLINQKEFYFLR